MTSARAPSRSAERTSPTASGRQAGPLERRPQHVVDEHGDRAERRAAGPQHGGVQALQELPGDVERDVRARLEVRADRPDRDPPLADDQAVRERPRADLPLERLDRGRRLDLAGDRLDPPVVEAEPIEHPLVQLPGGRIRVGSVRREDRRRRSRTSAAGLASAAATASSVRRRRLAGGKRLLLDLFTHALSYV